MFSKTERQIARKTTWTAADQVEFEDALSKKRNETTRHRLIHAKAKALMGTHPEAAIELIKRTKPSPPADVYYFNETLASLELSLGRRQEAFAQLFEPATALLKLDPDYGPRHKADVFGPLGTTIIFAVTHGYDDKFEDLLDALDGSDYKRLDPKEKYDFPAGLFWGACYMAEKLGQMDRARTYEEFALMRPLSYSLVAPACWRLWLFKKHRIGAKNFCGILAQPGYDLKDMQDWAKTSPFLRETSMHLEERDGAWCFSMIWEEAAIQIEEGGKIEGLPLGFTKAHLKGFAMDDLSLLRWKTVGDFDRAYVNHAIDLLTYIEREDRLRDNLKR